MPDATVRTSLAADYFQGYSVVGLIAVIGVLFVAVAFGAGRLLRPVVPTPEKLLTYECGVDPVGEGWAHTQVRYYVYAFLYVIFAVDSIFLFPWATVFAAPRFRRRHAGGDVHLPRLPRRRPALRMEEGRPGMDVTNARPATATGTELPSCPPAAPSNDAGWARSPGWLPNP